MKDTVRFAKARVHFIGIGGIGMCGLAELLHNMGVQVKGSDQSENQQTLHLREKGIKVQIGHCDENLDDVDVAAQRTTLGLGTIATQAADNVAITGGDITGATMSSKQDYDADLSTISAPGNDKVFYSTGSGAVATVGLGTSGTFLKSQGAGSAPTRSTISATPGGSDTQVQFNDSGAFGGDAGFVYDKTLNNLSIDNTVEAGLFKGKQSATVAGYNRFYELSGNGTNYIGFTVPDAITNTYSLKLHQGR